MARKMKLKFNSIVAPLQKLLEKLETYIEQCKAEQKKKDEQIQELPLC